MIQIKDKCLNFGLLVEPKHLKVLKFIKSVTENFYITGSIALSLLGIIRRPINDVDVVIWDKEELKKIFEAFGGEFFTNYNDEKETDFEDCSPKHLRFKLYDVNVCVFFMQYERVQEVELDGERYNISDPKFIFSAKFNYVEDILRGQLTDQSLKRLLKNISDIRSYVFYLNNQQ